MKKTLIILLTISYIHVSAQRCDTLGVMLELQATTKIQSLIMGDSGCIKAVVIGNGLILNKDTLSTNITLGDLVSALPYYTGDSAAFANGLTVGDPYLLECENEYNLPAGIFKVVKVCGFSCSSILIYYPNDATAISTGIEPGREYILDESNIYGIALGFIKIVTSGTPPSQTLICSTTLPSYSNDLTALIGGMAIGDHYKTSVDNTYGAPVNIERAVSNASTTNADASSCCDIDEILQYYSNDSSAIAGGLTSGRWYYLSSSNTYGYPQGTKKQVQ